MKLSATKREITGKKVKNLRAEGKVPAAVFGPSMSSTSITVDAKEFDKVFKKQGYNKFFQLEIEGDKAVRVLVKEANMHPLKDYYVDISLYAVDENKKLNVEVPIILEGEAPAVKQKVGFLVNPMHSITVHTLPKDLPDSFVVDINSLEQIGDSVHIRDLTIPEGVELDSAIDTASAIVFIAAPQKEIVEEVAPVEGEEGAEGEAKPGEEGAAASEEAKEE